MHFFDNIIKRAKDIKDMIHSYQNDHFEENEKEEEDDDD